MPFIPHTVGQYVHPPGTVDHQMLKILGRIWVQFWAWQIFPATYRPRNGVRPGPKLGSHTSYFPKNFHCLIPICSKISGGGEKCAEIVTTFENSFIYVKKNRKVTTDFDRRLLSTSIFGNFRAMKLKFSGKF